MNDKLRVNITLNESNSILPWASSIDPNMQIQDGSKKENHKIFQESSLKRGYYLLKYSEKTIQLKERMYMCVSVTLWGVGVYMCVCVGERERERDWERGAAKRNRSGFYE